MPPALQTSSRSQYAPEIIRVNNIADHPDLAKRRRTSAADRGVQARHSQSVLDRHCYATSFIELCDGTSAAAPASSPVAMPSLFPFPKAGEPGHARSEERRVGKECR